MIGGNAFRAADSDSTAANWAQTASSSTSSVPARMSSSDWVVQSSNASQSQPVALELPKSMVVNGDACATAETGTVNTGFAPNYVGQQPNPSDYVATSSEQLSSNISSSARDPVSAQQQFSTQSRDVKREEQIHCETRHVHHMEVEQQQGGSIVANSCQPTFNQTHDDTVMSLRNTEPRQEQPYFNEQTFVNSIVNGIGDARQVYNGVVDGDSTTPAPMLKQGVASSIPSQMRLQDHLAELHQASICVNQNVIQQSRETGLSSQSSPHGVVSTTVMQDSSKLESLKEGKSRRSLYFCKTVSSVSIECFSTFAFP